MVKTVVHDSILFFLRVSRSVHVTLIDLAM